MNTRTPHQPPLYRNKIAALHQQPRTARQLGTPLPPQRPGTHPAPAPTTHLAVFDHLVKVGRKHVEGDVVSARGQPLLHGAQVHGVLHREERKQENKGGQRKKGHQRAAAAAAACVICIHPSSRRCAVGGATTAATIGLRHVTTPPPTTLLLHSTHNDDCVIVGHVCSGDGVQEGRGVGVALHLAQQHGHELVQRLLHTGGGGALDSRQSVHHKCVPSRPRTSSSTA